MKNAAQKIATMIIIAIGIVFGVILAIISVTIINNVDALGGIFTNDKIGFTLLLILAIVFVGLSVYLIISLFGGKANIKTMVLTSDNFSAVSTTNKVVRGVIKTCVKSIGGMKLKQTKITEDDKPGFKLGVFVKISEGTIQNQTQTLKFLLEDSFKSQLGFCFNSIIIKVVSLTSGFEPDLSRARAHMEAVEKEEDCKASCKIAEPSPAEQAVLEENLTPAELEMVERQPSENLEQFESAIEQKETETEDKQQLATEGELKEEFEKEQIVEQADLAQVQDSDAAVDEKLQNEFNASLEDIEDTDEPIDLTEETIVSESTQSREKEEETETEA